MQCYTILYFPQLLTTQIQSLRFSHITNHNIQNTQRPNFPLHNTSTQTHSKYLLQKVHQKPIKANNYNPKKNYILNTSFTATHQSKSVNLISSRSRPNHAEHKTLFSRRRRSPEE